MRRDARAQPYVTASSMYDRMMAQDRIAARYLAARHGSIPDAVKMFVDTLEWRQREEVDQLLLKPDPIIADVALRIREGFPHGVDVKGRPVMVHEAAHLDVNAVLKDFTFDQCLRYVTHWI